MQLPPLKKLYYSITEVAEMTGLKPHILRYWETEFPFLKPKRNRAGNRAYRKRDIEMVLLIKKLLYEEGYTIEGAKQKIRQMRRQKKSAGRKGEELDPQCREFLREILAELEKVRDALK
ncbi:MerR family transcriptional regulator [bacterium]|nr:MerR family transcriptional regulator [bacterium]